MPTISKKFELNPGVAGTYIASGIQKPDAVSGFNYAFFAATLSKPGKTQSITGCFHIIKLVRFPLGVPIGPAQIKTKKQD